LDKWFKRDDILTSTGKTSGTRYALVEHEKILKDLAKEFLFHNPLHAGEFPAVR
jgi:hypothetical protein